MVDGKAQSSEDMAYRVSVVVAHQKAYGNPLDTLRRIADQRPDGVGQIIVVVDSYDGVVESVRRQFPEVEVIEISPGALTPQLWARGIRASAERLVALTTTQMLPDPGWVKSMVAAHRSGPWFAVGGPILCSPAVRRCDLAVYWLRYSGFASADGEVDTIAGDNACYRRADLEPYLDRICRDGFWENEIHAVLRRKGARLAVVPGARVQFRGEASFFAFVRQRLIHGRRFGMNRVSRQSLLKKSLLVVGWPLLALGFLARISCNAIRARGTLRFIAAFPALLCVLAAWSVGELQGYIDGLRS